MALMDKKISQELMSVSAETSDRQEMDINTSKEEDCLISKGTSRYEVRSDIC